MVTCGSVNHASSAASAMSASARKFSAPPTHIPLMATITGTSSTRPGQKSSACTPIVASGRRPDDRSAVSAPAVKARPAPVTMTQRSSGSSRTRAQNAASSDCSWLLSAFSRSGRFNVTVRIPPSASQRKVCGVSKPAGSRAMRLPSVVVNRLVTYSIDDKQPSRYAYGEGALTRPVRQGRKAGMDFKTDELHTEIRAAVRRMCADFPDEYWAEHDESKEFPWDFYEAVAKAGWLGLTIPAEYGGGDLGVAEAAIVEQEIAASGAGMNGCSAVHIGIFGVEPIIRHGSPELKQRFLPRLMAGDLQV